MISFKRIYIEITNICNKNCSFCSKDIKVKKEMTVSEFEHILKEIDPFTKYIYLHVKGEPLLHSHLEEILQLCEKYHKKVNITTNGTLLEKNYSILKKSKAIYQINISLHSFEEEYLLPYLTKIYAISEELVSTSPIQIIYRLWAYHENKFSKEQQEIFEQLKNQYGISLEAEETFMCQSNIKLKEKLYLNKNAYFEWPNLQLKDVGCTGSCQGTRTHIGILADGTVIPCCLDSSGIINLGNIFEKKLTDILIGDRFQNMRTSFAKKEVKESLCRHCQYRLRFSENNDEQKSFSK